MSKHVANLCPACLAGTCELHGPGQREATRRKAANARPTTNHSEGGGGPDGDIGSVRRNQPNRRDGRRPPADVARRHTPPSPGPFGR